MIKPSPETVLDARLFAEAADEAQPPPGVINVVQGSATTGAYLVAHPGVDKIAFTGSEAVGRWGAETAGHMLSPVTVELGGKAAAIIDRVEAYIAAGRAEGARLTTGVDGRGARTRAGSSSPRS